jgi:hypothetical protein
VAKVQEVRVLVTAMAVTVVIRVAASVVRMVAALVVMMAVVTAAARAALWAAARELVGAGAMVEYAAVMAVEHTVVVAVAMLEVEEDQEANLAAGMEMREVIRAAAVQMVEEQQVKVVTAADAVMTGAPAGACVVMAVVAKVVGPAVALVVARACSSASRSCDGQQYHWANQRAYSGRSHHIPMHLRTTCSRMVHS